ncbi:hypothetical protein [Desulfobacter postgatei]|jgi:hypothetical protein|uniref:hypothetical protein n=1 Tax=Desulfobacter postgatei TaxID=2293 RepID=UPI002A364CB9|nr:hypothetical protein [Desulfobacter postgatei]MDX9965290.1 hypothetical protein [Desulfobacter postgatei]
MFTNDNLKETHMIQSIHLLYPVQGKSNLEIIKRLHRSLIDGFPKLFKNSLVPDTPPPNTNDYFIVDQKNRRHIVMSDKVIQYDENKVLNNTSFNNVGKFLYNFYLENMGVKPEDLRLIGKVRDYTLEVDEVDVDRFDLFKSRYTVLLGKDLDTIDIHLKFVENNKNIHMYLSTKKADDEDDKPPFSIKIDINNYDQVSGLTDESYNDIISFADSFHKDSLVELLNNKLFGGGTGE